ncbi:hypothetical protein KVR01_012264 [Diaporthe batatas]|uniref:uncharacterized protein n=1 Tax=Diaporthe batatas TaxID=748121 RepID=UPI001D04A7B8|nr:uncharacterized protein KVR01_012264 [Diaporthe batatas]KAG8157992.1 hypothetical protein KVR01_012264 [Diaporthe batatas]
MGFTDFPQDAGLNDLNTWLSTRSYIIGHAASQADVACFQALKQSPDAAEHPHAARWWAHIASYEADFTTLPGDASKPYTAYGPDIVAAEAEENDDVDLFGSEEEEEQDAEAARVREERLAAYKEERAGKPKAAAKSVVIMDVKPWDDETDMQALEASIRGIEKDGLVWGASKLMPIGYGVKKLQISLVVEDEKVSLQDLEEEIAGFDDYVQSTDIATMQKL